MAEKTYTIKDVANIAGVSPAAVSRYMNDGSLSEEKREKIREAIRKTGYRPNLMAQSMRTGKGGQIGVIVPKIHSDSVSQIMAGISDTLTERNYLTMLGSTEGSRDMELRYLENMQNSQVAGIILMGVTMTPSLSDAIRNSSVPVVITGQNFAGLPCVYHNDSGAMEELTRRIIRKGRKHVVYIGVSTKDIAAGLNRQNGVLRAWKEAGLPEEDPRAERPQSIRGTLHRRRIQSKGKGRCARGTRRDKGALCGETGIGSGGKRAPQGVQQGNRTI